MEEARLPQVFTNGTLPATIAEQLATITTGYTPDSEHELQEPSYYDYPVLKAPVWRWEIIWYFFFGGLAAGCYVIASIAALFGSREDRPVARAGYYLSLLSVLPCPILLIKDLGRPDRFLHMLRIFKVKSPMSMGTWGLISFSLFSGVTAVIQAARDGILGRWWGSRLLAAFPQRFLAIPGSALGVFLGGYTGVLLTATSIPLWSRSKVLGAIFISSAVSTSSALISLVLRLTRTPAQALHKLERLEWVALLVEMAGLFAFLRVLHCRFSSIVLLRVVGSAGDPLVDPPGRPGQRRSSGRGLPAVGAGCVHTARLRPELFRGQSSPGRGAAQDICPV